MPYTLRRLPLILFLVGAALRILYAWQADPRMVNDDHFAVIRIMLNEGRWPTPAEGWQTYQPPLYHFLGAITYHMIAGDVEPDQQVLANSRHAAGRKAVQLISAVAGIFTLILVMATLRLLFPDQWAAQSAGMAFAAFLPAHVYMSAMATNDSLAYLWASLCIYAALRGLIQNSGFRVQKGWWVVAGLAAALAMWTKHYGLGSWVVLLAAIPLSLTLEDRSAGRSAARGAGLAAALALALGIWPYVRTWRLTGNPLASNYVLRPHTMDDQFPGRLDDVSFLTFRLGRLLARPWRHGDTIDSFWTQLYARTWFDHDTTMTLHQYRPWFEHMGHIWRDRTIDGRERERRQLIWDERIVPRRLLWEGRLLLGLGLFPTLLVVVGAVGTWAARKLEPRSEVLMVSLGMGILAPFYQTYRQPFHSSMKAAFVLPALIALTVFFVKGWQMLAPHRIKSLRWLVGLNLAVLAAVAVWHSIDLSYVFLNSPEYFPRLIPNY